MLGDPAGTRDEEVGTPEPKPGDGPAADAVCATAPRPAKLANELALTSTATTTPGQNLRRANIAFAGVVNRDAPT